MNTVFRYLYRDASNYKQWGEVTFLGVPSDWEMSKRRLLSALEGGEFFIAEQIRVPSVFPPTWPMYADDHCWHEFDAIETTALDPTDRFGRNFEELLNEVEQAAAQGWEAFDPQERELSRRRSILKRV